MNDPNVTRAPCLFCGRTDAKLTAEHVYGDWMKRARPHSGTSRTRRVWQDHDGEWVMTEDQTDQGARHQTKVLPRRVCDPCNHYLGAEVEETTIPVLTELFTIPDEEKQYDTKAAMAVVRWATKVAMVYEWTYGPRHRAIPQRQREKFRRTLSPPEQTIIAIATHEGNQWAGLDSHWSVNLGRDGSAPPVNPDGLPTNSYISAWGFDNLYLIVVGTTFGIPIRDITKFRPTKMIRLWPQPRPFSWPTTGFFSDGELFDLGGHAPDLWFPIDAPPGRRLSPFS